MEFYYSDVRGKYGPLSAEEMNERISTISPMTKIRAMFDGKKQHETELYKIIARNGSENPFNVHGLENKPEDVKKLKNETKKKKKKTDEQQKEQIKTVTYALKMPPAPETTPPEVQESEEYNKTALDLITFVDDDENAKNSAGAFAELALSQSQLARICDTVILPALFRTDWKAIATFCSHVVKCEVIRTGSSLFRAALMKDFVEKSMLLFEKNRIPKTSMEHFYDVLHAMLCSITPSDETPTDGLVSLGTLIDLLDVIIADFTRLHREDTGSPFELMAIVSIIKALAIVPEDGSPRSLAINRYAPHIKAKVLSRLKIGDTIVSMLLKSMLIDKVTFASLRSWEDAKELYPLLYPQPTSLQALVDFMMGGKCKLLQ